jgi:SET domain
MREKKTLLDIAKTVSSTYQKNGFFLSRHINVAQTASKGLGLSAVGALVASDTLVRVPRMVWINYSANFAASKAEEANRSFVESIRQLAASLLSHSPESQSNLVRTSCLAIDLAFKRQEFMQNVAPIDPYVELLVASSYPMDRASVPHPVSVIDAENPRGNDRDEEFLKGSKTLSVLNKRRKLYSFLANSLFPGSNDIELRQDFLWAVGIILSRAISDARTHVPLTLVPVLDLANHTSDPPLLNAAHKYDAQSGEFSLVALRDISEGEEILISYGAGRDTPSFMSIYGFFDDSVHQRNDTLTVSLKSACQQTSSLSHSDSGSAPPLTGGILKKLDSAQVQFQVHYIVSQRADEWRGISTALSSHMDSVTNSDAERSEDDVISINAYVDEVLSRLKGILGGSGGGRNGDIFTRATETDLEQIAIQSMASVDSTLRGFLVDSTPVSSSSSADAEGCRNDEISIDYELVMAAEKRLEYLGTEQQLLLQGGSPHLDLDSGVMRWRALCAAVASRELEAALRLRTLLHTLLIASRLKRQLLSRSWKQS